MSDRNFTYGDGFEPWQRIMLNQASRGSQTIGKITRYAPLSSEKTKNEEETK